MIRACPFELHFSSLGHSSFEASLANTSAGGLSLSKKGLEGLKQCLFSINFHVKNGRKFQRTQNIHTYVGARRKPIQNNTIFKTVVLLKKIEERSITPHRDLNSNSHIHFWTGL